MNFYIETYKNESSVISLFAFIDIYRTVSLFLFSLLEPTFFLNDFFFLFYDKETGVCSEACKSFSVKKRPSINPQGNQIKYILFFRKPITIGDLVLYIFYGANNVTNNTQLISFINLKNVYITFY